MVLGSLSLASRRTEERTLQCNTLTIMRFKLLLLLSVWHRAQYTAPCQTQLSIINAISAKVKVTVAITHAWNQLQLEASQTKPNQTPPVSLSDHTSLPRHFSPCVCVCVCVCVNALDHSNDRQVACLGTDAVSTKGLFEREGERCFHKSSYRTAGIMLSLVGDVPCARKPESASNG